MSFHAKTRPIHSSLCSLSLKTKQKMNQIYNFKLFEKLLVSFFFFNKYIDGVDLEFCGLRVAKELTKVFDGLLVLVCWRLV